VVLGKISERKTKDGAYFKKEKMVREDKCYGEII
jgi:hypothetical protein